MIVCVRVCVLQLRTATSEEQQRVIRIKMRDREHILHHDGKKHPRHGTHG